MTRSLPDTSDPEGQVCAYTIPDGGSQLLDVAYGQTLRLVDRNGGAAVQLLVVVAGDKRDRISAPNTTVLNKGMYFTVGGVLYSYFYQPLMTITADSVGRHSMLPTPLPTNTPEAQRHSHLGRHLLIEAAGKLGLTAAQTPFPFQLFIHHELTDTGDVSAAVSKSSAGDYVELRAEMDVKVVVVNNPALVEKTARGGNTTIAVSVHQPADKD